MRESKETTITIRLSDEEKGVLEKAAKEDCMSLSQYIRHRVLEDREKIQENQQPYYAEFLNKNLPMITRVLLDIFYHTRGLARQSLTDEDYDEIDAEKATDYKNLNIQKKQNDDNNTE